ncbi:MAG: hypothetical protein IJK13_00430 [Lachnospiraceae bacterium]|nr:hypothetical protein [Lachnospiraceae bacterium]MBQ9580467.1 hypothetical protein [Lachnospiraceae bacterium]MBR0434456.1 hypothetical protein [Lachnospiraceae bacterium]
MLKVNAAVNKSTGDIVRNAVIAIVSLFVNGFGIYLTMRANIGASPWDVFNLGLSKTFGILYGTASIGVSLTILLIDILLKEPIGIAMFIDAIVVGKSVDFFNFIDIVPKADNIVISIVMMGIGLFIIGYTQLFYMRSSLGCGPRDSLLIGLKKRLKRIPIGVVSIAILSTATLIGYLLGGPVGLGTLICALCAGPIMQFAFQSLSFEATAIRHQNLKESFKIMINDMRNGKRKCIFNH